MTITTERLIEAEPDVVFDVITDIDGLPTRNDAMRRVVEAPDEVSAGSQWVVEFTALGRTWSSRSTVVAIDRSARRFIYRSATDDGNPSYADWTWTVTPSGRGCVVAVSADLHPMTFWRRALLVHVRSRQLRRTEIPGSLDRLARAVDAAQVP